MKIILETARLQQRTPAHEYLHKQLGLPAYYGGNLDALYDCLSTMGETELVLHGGYEPDSYCGALVRVMRSAARDNPELTVTFAPDTK